MRTSVHGIRFGDRPWNALRRQPTECTCRVHRTHTQPTAARCPIAPRSRYRQRGHVSAHAGHATPRAGHVLVTCRSRDASHLNCAGQGAGQSGCRSVRRSVRVQVRVQVRAQVICHAPSWFRQVTAVASYKQVTSRPPHRSRHGPPQVTSRPPRGHVTGRVH